MKPIRRTITRLMNWRDRDVIGHTKCIDIPEARAVARRMLAEARRKGLSESDIRHQKDAMVDLMNHHKVSPGIVTSVLEAAETSTIGQVRMVVDHEGFDPQYLPDYARDMKPGNRYGLAAVMSDLDSRAAIRKARQKKKGDTARIKLG